MRMWQIRAVLSVLVFVVVGIGIGIGLCTYLPQCVTGISYAISIIPGTICMSRLPGTQQIVRSNFHLFCTSASTFLPDLFLLMMLYKLCDFTQTLGARTYGVGSNLNLSQMPPILGRKAKHVRQKYRRYFVHSQNFGFVLQIL